jgi:transcriptional regulator with PAS, ATPase and Fis domain
LDEILNLPLPVQSKLLRVLQEHEVVRLGDSKPTRVRLRVVAAAQGSIEEAVNNGRFRFDLWQRLNGMTVELPPLRERKEDIIPLFVRLLQQGRTTAPPSLEPKRIEALLLYRWPGNLRELASFAQDVGRRHGDVGTLSKAVLRPQMIDPRQRPEAVVSDTPVKEPVRRSTTDASMRQAIVEMLKQTGDNKSQAARNLQISLAHLNRVLANMDK